MVGGDGGPGPVSCWSRGCPLIPVVWVDVSAWVQTPALPLPAVEPAQVPLPHSASSPHVCTTETAPVAQVECCDEPQGAWVAKPTQQHCVLAHGRQSGPCLAAAWGRCEQRPLSGHGLVPVLVPTHGIRPLPCSARFSEAGAARPFLREESCLMAKALGANLCNHFTVHPFLLSSPFADTLDEFKEMNKGMWKKLQEKFAPGDPEEKHKAWARALPRPRT